MPPNEMPYSVYLAAKFPRREEMRSLAKLLHDEYGLVINSTWLYAETNIKTASVDERQRFARLDLMDVLRSDWIVNFTEGQKDMVPWEVARGGRHVEFGAQLAMRMSDVLGPCGEIRRCIIIGPRENIFHWEKEVEQFDNTDAFIATLQKR